MQTGAITDYIDVAQLVLYAFWIFFAGLIYYLHRRTSARAIRSSRTFPARRPSSASRRCRRPRPIASPTARASPCRGRPRPPRRRTARRSPAIRARRSCRTARRCAPASARAPMRDRRDVPDVTIDGEPRILPLRSVADFGVDRHDRDPRGLPVVGSDGVVGGVVRDVWVDRCGGALPLSRGRRLPAAARRCCCRSTSPASARAASSGATR